MYQENDLYITCLIHSSNIVKGLVYALNCVESSIPNRAGET